MRFLILLAILLVPAAAAAAPPPATPHLDAQVGVGLGLLHVDGPRTVDTDDGVHAGLVASLAVRIGGRWSLVADASIWRGTMSCLADGACWKFAIEDVRIAGAGVRWSPRPRWYVQGLGVAAHSVYQPDPDFRRTWWSTGGALAVGWRRTLGGAGFVGFELRAVAYRGRADDTELTVVSGTGILGIGHAW